MGETLTCEDCALAREMWPDYKVGSRGCNHCMARLIGFVLSSNCGQEEKKVRARNLAGDSKEIRELVKRKEWFEKVDKAAKQSAREAADKAVSRVRGRTARRG